MTGSRSLRVVGWSLALLSLAGCADEASFANPSDGSYIFAMTPEVPALAEGEEASLYVIEQRALLPIVPPTEAELAALAIPAGMTLPFSRLPWVKSGDVAMEVDFTLSNLGDDPVIATVTMNGANEFDEYYPGHVETDEAMLRGVSQWERLYLIQGGERISGTIREEEIVEAEVDLATIVNGAPNPWQVLYRPNQWDGTGPIADLIRPYIPAVIPGLVGVRMGIATDEPATLVLEWSLSVRDPNNAERLARGAGTATWALPTPTQFVGSDHVMYEE